jgi:hypothetical protein
MELPQVMKPIDPQALSGDEQVVPSALQQLFASWQQPSMGSVQAALKRVRDELEDGGGRWPGAVETALRRVLRDAEGCLREVEMAVAAAETVRFTPGAPQLALSAAHDLYDVAATAT